MNRREAEELLPWFINGTLAVDEAQAVQAFIDSGEIASDALNELQLFADTISETTIDEPAYNPNILKKALSQLDETVQEQPEPPLVVRESRVEQPGFLQSLFNNFNWSPMAMVALGAQFAVILGLLVALGTNSESSDPGGFEVVTGGSQLEADLTVLFAPNTQEADIRALLLAVDATIVAGPTASGMYQISLAEGQDVALAQESLNTSVLTAYVQPVAKP